MDMKLRRLLCRVGIHAWVTEFPYIGEKDPVLVFTLRDRCTCCGKTTDPW